MAEITLTEDTRVTLGAHKLTIAELDRTVSSVPRPPVDPGQPYSAEMAEADIERIASALALAWVRAFSAKHVDGAHETNGGDWRPAAALLLSRLHGWKLAAPPESPGHAYARRVHDGDER